MIARQQAVIDELQRRIAALEGGLKGKGRPRNAGQQTGCKVRAGREEGAKKAPAPRL